jgi:ADP-heptose:LPS heptosyltransferase
MQEIRRILVIKLDHIGDFLLSTPAIRALRRAYPSAELIGVVGSCSAAVARVNPHLDRVITYDAAWFRRGRMGIVGWGRNLWVRLRLLGLRADLAVNLRGDHGNLLFTYLTGARLRAAHANAPEDGIYRCPFWLTHPALYRDGVHATERCLDVAAAVGAVPCGLHLEFPVSPAADREAGELFARLFPPACPPLVAIHPGGGWPLNWWPAERYAALADWIVETQKMAVLFVGGPGERALVDGIRSRMRQPAVSVCGETTLGVLAAILRKARLFVGNDGGVMHVAEAMETPLVVLFGCSPAQEFGPRSSRVRIVQGPAPDPPCPQQEWGITLTCRDQPCMKGIPLAAVQAAVAESLAVVEPVLPGESPVRNGESEGRVDVVV